MAYSYNKKWSADTLYVMGESWKYAKRKKDIPKCPHNASSHSYEMSRIGKSKETESRLMVANVGDKV